MKLTRRRFGIFSFAAISMLLLLNFGCEKERLLEPEVELKSGAIEKNEKYLIGFHALPDVNLISNLGGEVTRTFTIVPAVAANLPPQAIEALKRNPKISYVEPDYEVFATSQTVPWGIKRVFSPPTWTTTKGSGIRVAILDSGIDEHHEDLKDNVKGGKTTVDNTHWGSDGSGHGTHVAGTVAALDNTLGVVGVAPEVQLYAVKVLNDGGSGTVSSVVAGIEWAVEQKIPVLNMSLGSSQSSTTLKTACDNAYAAGHLIVSSAGNSGNPGGKGDNVGYPAAYESVIAVAASTSNDKRASYSSTGPAVELIAPGSNILSTVPGNKYSSYNGTSMASPHVAGVAALVWATNPTSLTNAQVRQILKDTAEDLGLPAEHQGSGLTRADLAVAAANLNQTTTGSITGKVTDGTNPIAGASIVVDNTNFSAISDDFGDYTISNIPTGSYSVTASKSGYEASTETVPVNENQQSTQNFILTKIPTYTVSGTVTDGSTAIKDALVIIEGTEHEAITNANGYYSISNVEAGNYTITASLSGYESSSESIVLVDSDLIVDFSLTEITTGGITLTATGYKVRGRQKADLTWSVASGINVEIFRDGVSIATTANDGAFTDNIDSLGGGSYTYRVCETDGSTCSNEATVVF